MESRLSINQIADIAGFSVATISRVINNRGGYSKETEEKVHRIIEEYNYTPNANASGLRTNRSHSIGVMVPDIMNEFFAKIIRELDLYFLKHRYVVLICDSNEDSALENMHLRNLLTKNVDGLIYISGKNEVLKPEQIGVPVVYVDRSPKNAEVLVHSDNVTGGYLATKELIDAGCKKIMFFGDERLRSPVRRRRDGCRKALREAGFKNDKMFFVGSLPDYESSRQRMREILHDEGCYFDGVFTTNDMMALGVIDALRESGYSVPGDVKVVGYDNIPTSEFCVPKITTVTQDTKEIADRAADALLKMIHGESIEKKDIIIPVALTKRESTSLTK